MLQRQARVALGLGTLLACVAWARVFLFYGGTRNATAISLSCFVIVVSSVVLGAALPFIMAQPPPRPPRARRQRAELQVSLELEVRQPSGRSSAVRRVRLVRGEGRSVFT